MSFILGLKPGVKRNGKWRKSEEEKNMAGVRKKRRDCWRWGERGGGEMGVRWVRVRHSWQRNRRGVEGG